MGTAMPDSLIGWQAGVSPRRLGAVRMGGRVAHQRLVDARDQASLFVEQGGSLNADASRHLPALACSLVYAALRSVVRKHKQHQLTLVKLPRTGGLSQCWRFAPSSGIG